MTESHRVTNLSVDVVAAPPERESTLANLIELYVYDFSEHLDLELGADGRFGYRDLSLYWTTAERHPFLIEVNGALAGFVLVQQGSRITGDSDIWDMAEFFVMRGYRRKHIGAKAAEQVWRKFAGKWEVRVLDRNRPAVTFWQRTISEFIGRPVESMPFEANGATRQLFTFDTRTTT